MLLMLETKYKSLRSVGDVSWDTWYGVLAEVKSPILDEGAIAYHAARPHSAVCLAALRQKSAFAVDHPVAIRHRNPFYMESTGSFAGMLTFPQWSNAIEYWKEYSFPDRDTYTQEGLWELVRDTEHFLSVDKRQVYSREILGYLTSDGGPTEETLRRWFGHDPNEFPQIFRAWRDVGEDIGLYPPVHEVVRMDEGVEILFLNGIRIYENNGNVRIFGYSN